MSIVQDARADVSLPITDQSVTFAEANRRLKNGQVDEHEAKVVVPQWRPKFHTVSYKLEGIEDLTDDAYEQRHSKHEYDEKLIKKWDMRRQREEYERKKLLKERNETLYLQPPPRVQNKNKKPKGDETTSNGQVSLDSLLHKALDLQYIEVLDEKAQALLLDQMSDIAGKLKDCVATGPTPSGEKMPSSSRGRRTKEVQENKPPVEAAAVDLNKSKSLLPKETALQANTKSNDNINNIIKTRKLLKSPVKSYPIISPLWSPNAAVSESPPKKSVLSSSTKRPRKSDAFLLTDKNCSSGSSIYDDIDLDFRKLDSEDTSGIPHHLNHSTLLLRQRPTTRSRSSSRSLSVDHFAKIESSEGDNSNGHSSVSSTSLQAVPNQRKRQRKGRQSSPTTASFTKRIRIN